MIALLLLCLGTAESAPMGARVPPSAPLNLQQMLDLQRIQQIPISMLAAPQPLVLLLPNDAPNANDVEQNDINTKSDFGKVDQDLDSIVIDAPSEDIPPKAFVLLPSGRFSIGDFISSIPWLPIEVNVPDTISWAYNGISNGISGIISIIGQRLPFRKPTMDQTTNANLKSILNNLKMRNAISRPILVMPFETQRLNLPIEV